MIIDNIRTLLGAIRTANFEENINGLIVSLDAKKAFDSVDHNYIENTLKKFGLKKFVPVFRALYADLSSDIIINGKIVPGYLIKRGVKQGDALSCILFILCMEPLLKNIEKNQEIQSLPSQDLDSNLPRVVAYADDVNGIIANDPRTLQELFREYERLTKLAGLELNAEKTEILPIISENLRIDKTQLIFHFEYFNKNYILKPVPETRINGILFQQNEAEMRTANVENVRKKIEKQLKSWTARQLTILGKILITKTFGVSQIIFLLQSMTLTDADFKLLNHVLYKFIWNRHFMAAKAPERIKREIVNKSIKLGGLGMLDLILLDKSLKLKALGRLLVSNHPFLTLVRNKLNLRDFFAPNLNSRVDDLTLEGINLLTGDRNLLLRSNSLDGNSYFIKALKSVKIKRTLNRNGLASLAWFNLRRLGKTLVNDLDRDDLRRTEPFIERNLRERLKASFLNTWPNLTEDVNLCVVNGSKFIPLHKLSSKQIRTIRGDKQPITFFKIGALATPSQGINWANCLSKVTNVKHQDIFLRLAHGELYSKERLHRYRLVDSASCARCNDIETLKHKYFECPYVAEIWRKTLQVTNKLRTSIDPNETLIERALCCTNEPNTIAITIHAEILLRIRRLKDGDANLLLLPKLFIKYSLDFIKRRETCEAKLEALTELMQE